MGPGYRPPGAPGAAVGAAYFRPDANHLARARSRTDSRVLDRSRVVTLAWAARLPGPARGARGRWSAGTSPGCVAVDDRRPGRGRLGRRARPGCTTRCWWSRSAFGTVGMARAHRGPRGRRCWCEAAPRARRTSPLGVMLATSLADHRRSSGWSAATGPSGRTRSPCSTQPRVPLGPRVVGRRRSPGSLIVLVVDAGTPRDRAPAGVRRPRRAGGRSWSPPTGSCWAVTTSPTSSAACLLGAGDGAARAGGLHPAAAQPRRSPPSRCPDGPPPSRTLAVILNPIKVEDVGAVPLHRRRDGHGGRLVGAVVVLHHRRGPRHRHGRDGRGRRRRPGAGLRRRRHRPRGLRRARRHRHPGRDHPGRHRQPAGPQPRHPALPARRRSTSRSPARTAPSTWSR